ncbi:MAG: NAD-dependent dehydratase, partial [Rhodospirillales bacterium]|nr:NAD-dependent dehydratase [Rhodospirillales bacterium]
LRLLQAVDRGVPLPLGAVNNRRSLLYVENFASALLACLTRPEAAGKTYFVRDGEDVPSAELVRRLARALERPARLLPVPPALLRLAGAAVGKKAAVDRLLGSLTVDDDPLRRELGWAPPFTLDEGLAATARWYRQIGQ